MGAVAAVFLLFVAASASSFAASFDGVVVAVADGDTLTVLVDRRQVKVRLAEIDAPERHQAFGDASKQSLAEMCFQRPARVVEQGTDRYGRTVGRVWCAGVDSSDEQVRRGMAWVFDRYVRDKGLYGVQNQARADRRGLWADPAPVPPWTWRRDRR